MLRLRVVAPTFLVEEWALWRDAALGQTETDMRRMSRGSVDDDRCESAPLLLINQSGKSKSDIDADEIDNVSGVAHTLRRRLPTWVVIILCYSFLAVVYIVAYFASPPKSEWPAHLEQCPAQKKYCELLDGMSYLIQGVLCFTCASVLLLAWICESPRRPFTRFCADNSKSVLAALMTHFLAGGSAILIHDVTEGEYAVESCDWYFIIFVWDSFIGVSLTLILHQWSAHKFKSMPKFEFLSRIGDYESAPDPISGHREPSSTMDRVNRWGYQVLHWLLCAAFARIVDFGILYGLANELARVAAGVGWWACSKYQVQVKQWLNILVFPILLDSIQFLVQNFFLKNKGLLQEHESLKAAPISDANYGSTSCT